MDYSINKQMTCQQTRHLVDAYILNDPSLTIEDCKGIEFHLQNCPKCTQEYEKAGLVMNLVKKYWSGKTENQLIIKKTEQPVERRMTAKEGWKDLLQRCPDLAVVVKHQKRQRLLYRVSAVAACLIIGVSLFLAFSSYAKQKIALAPKPSVRIELVSKNGNILIPANQQIASCDELKTLVINGKHRLMMNINTVLAVEPVVEHSNIGCQVKLASGQIYTHVQHDGNPFIVDTANGQAVITGTTFDITATNSGTTLVVSEGTVRFESEEGVVNVAAGQISKIAGQSAPSIPLLCNTAELTAWATGYKPGPALARTGLDADDWYLALSLRKEPIVLAETDYDYWVKEKREWFKTNFPWIFELKNALAKEGIEVDYPELLIETGDVWRFVCLQRLQGRFSIPDFESLLKTATSYGFDKEWLLENIPIARLIQDKSSISENPTGLVAFDQLLKYANGTETTPYYLYFMDACRYLIETRSLIWFATDSGQFELTNKQQAEVLDLLQQEVIAATNYSNVLLYPENEKKKPLCGDDLCEILETRIVGYIENIKITEGKLLSIKLATGLITR